MAHDVFISHSSADKKVADAVCHRLEARDIRCWIAPRNVTGGRSYPEQISRAIAACRVMVLVFSAGANKSADVQKEVHIAFESNKKRLGVIVPFRVEDVPPSEALQYHISDLHWIDALTPPLEERLDELTATVAKLLADVSPEYQERRAARPRFDNDAAAKPEAAADMPAASASKTAPPRHARWLVVGPACAGVLIAIAALVAWRMDLFGLPAEITNGADMRLVLIRPGHFLMGSSQSVDRAGRPDEQQHRVDITRAFYMGACEVTRGQFRRFVEETAYTTQAEADGKGGWGFDQASNKLDGPDPKYNWHNPGFSQTDEDPVVNVSWNDAKAFCRWLGRKEDKAYRLPTEAEWEYACRAGTRTLFSNGDDGEALVEIANVADATFKGQFPDWTTTQRGDGYAFTAPVGRFKPNAFGLFDMHGNVAEWCQDGYDPDYYQASPTKDPPGSIQPGVFRVIRGGAFINSPTKCRSAARDKLEPGLRLCYVGFRVVREP
jgi:formylglycine-generating enzyme required for sulfatase activity